MYKMYNLHMKTISATDARNNLKSVMDMITKNDEVVVIKNHNNPEIIMMKYPRHYNPNLSDMTNFMANNPAFDFLADEPDLYTRDDLKKKYV